VLVDLAGTSNFRSDRRLIKNIGEVESPVLPMRDGFGRFEAVRPSEHVIDSAETQLGHDFAKLLGDKSHKVHDIICAAAKKFPQARVLRGNANRTGIQVADPHHDTAHRNQRRRGKTEFFRTEQSGYSDVATRLELAVGFYINT